MKAKSNLPKMSIYDIKRKTLETSPYFFSRSTLKFFNQRMSDFKVIRLFDEGKYLIFANRDHGVTRRKYNPVTNVLERINNI